MTRRLILTRHAKSAWDKPGLPDHDRPLNKRGKRAAEALGDWLRRNGYLPDQVLTSSARRTQDTLRRMQLDVVPDVTEHLYLVTANQILRVLSQAHGDTVLLLGHNPGIAQFAHEILAEPPTHPKFHVYPTGATLVVDFDIDDWAQAAWRGGEAVDFVVPRELVES
ncbi:SixA phosphatase family protein [Pseudodonghicola flavimaris]|uniref:Histidine phosphatase family protein n=1 Tax=Pseudodonghicola flavimaris TaxID=3050036 RepID=A0ABT7F278_9RHOB|nr:histidine phosphatase family protein [Pseudodonghicola flavimaris]MDK3018706.1 histidine phosphatase family protein [Pseudodonghicola flavimaris]